MENIYTQKSEVNTQNISTFFQNHTEQMNNLYNLLSQKINFKFLVLSLLLLGGLWERVMGQTYSTWNNTATWGRFTPAANRGANFVVTNNSYFGKVS